MLRRFSAEASRVHRWAFCRCTRDPVYDESGEDYLYPANYFVSIRLPQAIERAVLQAS